MQTALVSLGDSIGVDETIKYTGASNIIALVINFTRPTAIICAPVCAVKCRARMCGAKQTERMVRHK